jgi:hypothetical protein
MTGISTTLTPREREIVRTVIVELEDRRVLFDSLWVEQQDYAFQSIIEIRRLLTATLSALRPDSPAAPILRTMRSECHAFLTGAGQGGGWGAEFDLGLGRLRGVFGGALKTLTNRYGLKIHGELASILPAEPTLDDGTTERYERFKPKVFYALPPTDLPFDPREDD